MTIESVLVPLLSAAVAIGGALALQRVHAERLAALDRKLAALEAATQRTAQSNGKRISNNLSRVAVLQGQLSILVDLFVPIAEAKRMRHLTGAQGVPIAADDADSAEADAK